MVELALLGEPGLVASPLELTPERPFYTVDSLRHFRRENADAELHLLIGGDGFAELHTWKEWQEIIRLARLAVLTRPDWQWSEFRHRVPAELAELAETERVQFVTNQPVAVSATEIRQRLAEGRELPADAVPELVLQYIDKYSLYQ
jgi:nicotinate-nucleotide adenylyltransferase